MPRPDPARLVTDVARRIAELRERAGLTQDDLASALGVTLRYFQRLEQGKNITLHTVARIAAALDVEVVDLFTPPKSRPPRVGRPPLRIRD